MQSDVQTRWIAIIVGILVTAIALVGVYIGYLMLSGTSGTPETIAFVQEEYTGISEIDARAMPDFTLTDQSGQARAMSDLNGKPTLFTFGFTHCPDICPLTLGDMREIRSTLGERGDDLDFVFISVDGERDTPQALAEYFQTHRVDSFLVGLTGTPEAVRAAGEPYGLEVIFSEPNQIGAYSVDHTAGMFLLDGEGRWIRRYSFGTENGRIAADIRDVLAAN